MGDGAGGVDGDVLLVAVASKFWSLPNRSRVSMRSPRSSRPSIPNNWSTDSRRMSTSGLSTTIVPSRTFDRSDSATWARAPSFASLKKPAAPFTVWIARNSSFTVSASAVPSRARSFFSARSRCSRLSAMNSWSRLSASASMEASLRTARVAGWIREEGRAGRDLPRERSEIPSSEPGMRPPAPGLKSVIRRKSARKQPTIPAHQSLRAPTAAAGRAVWARRAGGGDCSRHRDSADKTACRADDWQRIAPR